MFPFDYMGCNMFMAGTMPPAVITLNWMKAGEPLFIPPWLKTTSFLLDPGLAIKQSPVNDTADVSNIVEFVTSFYDLAGANSYMVAVSLTRQYSYYVLTLYLPTFIIVIIAWLSMWFPFDSTRVSICTYVFLH